MTKEIFKPIPEYEGHYEVSNLGNVVSLKLGKRKYLSKNRNNYGYLCVNLCKNGVHKTYKIHQIVASCFWGFKPCGMDLVIDHINDIKSDNTIENLRVVTQRENSHKTQGKYSSNYKGVQRHRHYNRWTSNIVINMKQYYLGCFKSEHEAHLAYQNALQKHLNNEQPIQSSTKATENVC